MEVPVLRLKCIAERMGRALELIRAGPTLAVSRTLSLYRVGA